MAGCRLVGGQAVIDGVMMRNCDVYGLAIRHASGEILAQRWPWRSFCSRSWLGLPFVRGFPILLESLFNGIQALNRSVILAETAGEKKDDSVIWPSVLLAVVMAVALFVGLPHLLSLLMQWFGFGGDVDGFSFHIWDGFYKCAIFIAYIWLIALVPDIRRVFQYHGAEHKTIHAYEKCEEVNSSSAHAMSRLHPRCGTTFLLFVICISIVAQALFLPVLLKLWPAGNALAKHVLAIGWKLLLIVPISAIAYELIRFTARMPDGFTAIALQTPGLALQKLTTREPGSDQLDVAMVALIEALGSDAGECIRPVPYRHVECGPNEVLSSEK